MVNSDINCSISYFLPGPNKEAYRKASDKKTKLMHNDFFYA